MDRKQRQLLLGGFIVRERQPIHRMVVSTEKHPRLHFLMLPEPRFKDFLDGFRNNSAFQQLLSRLSRWFSSLS